MAQDRAGPGVPDRRGVRVGGVTDMTLYSPVGEFCVRSISSGAQLATHHLDLRMHCE
jgi:hypothetical protein